VLTSTNAQDYLGQRSISKEKDIQCMVNLFGNTRMQNILANRGPKSISMLAIKQDS